MALALALLLAASWRLDPSPRTVAWGHYDAATRPVLTIRSGDTVVFHTLLTTSPTRLEGATACPGRRWSRPARDLRPGPTATSGPGGHILTGPVFIEGAEPGDTLEIRIRQDRSGHPLRLQRLPPWRGASCTDDFPYARTKIIPLDRRRGWRASRPASTSRCVPSSAAWAWRRRRAGRAGQRAARRSTAATWTTRSWSPAPRCTFRSTRQGALFEVGDGHAGQGNGEVDVTAIETSLVGTFQFVVRKDMQLNSRAPRRRPTTSPWASTTTWSSPPRGGARDGRLPGRRARA